MTEPPDNEDESLEAARRLLTLMREEANDASRREWGSGCFWAVALCVLMFGLSSIRNDLYDGMVCLIFGVALLLCGLSILPPRRSVIANQIDVLEDVRAVGMLAESLDAMAHTLPDENQQAIVRALKRLLPRLEVDDASLLNTVQRSSLRIRLAQAEVAPISELDTELCLAVLGALERIGDGSDLPMLEQFARECAERSSMPADIKVAAASCVAVLRARAEQQKVGEGLLRAAAPPANAPGELLRPATGTNSTETRALLRPSSSTELDAHDGGDTP